MGAKFLVDLNEENEDRGFILNLSRVKEKSYVHVSMDFLIAEVKASLENDDFKKAYDFIEEAHNININSDSVFFLELITKAYEAIYEFEALDKDDILGNLEMKKKLIKAARFGRSSATATLTPEHKKILANVDELEESIDELMLLNRFKESFSKQKIDFRTLEVMELYSNDLAKELTEDCKEVLNKKINDENNIELFKGLYSEEFLNSEELNNSIKINFENYEQLRKRVENCYSLYRFNREKNIDKKISILTNGYFVKSFLGRPKLYKIYMIKKISLNKEALVNLDLFIKEADKIIVDLLMNEQREKSIPCI